MTHLKKATNPDWALHTIWWPESEDFLELKQMTTNETAFPRCPDQAYVSFSHRSLLLSLLWKKILCICQAIAKGGNVFFWLWPFRNSLLMILWAFSEGWEGQNSQILSSELQSDCWVLPKFVVSEFTIFTSILLIAHLLQHNSLEIMPCQTSLKCCCFAASSSATASCLYLHRTFRHALRWLFPCALAVPTRGLPWLL